MRKDVNHFIAGIILCILMVIGSVVLKPMVLNASTAEQIDEKIQKAILSEEWAEVVMLLDSVDVQTRSPILRTIKGHACLALNRNNESHRLFLSVSSSEDKKKWEEWATNFTRENPNKAVAYYLLGDAYTRFGNYHNAFAAYNKALELKRNHSLALNARGVLYACKGESDKAIADFCKITQSYLPFADAYINLGITLIRNKTASLAVLELFKKAMCLSPDFAVARNNLACAEFALGRWEDVVNDLETAHAKAPWFNTPVANMATFALMKDEIMLPVGNKKTKIKPGMSVEAVSQYVTAMSPEEARKNYLLAQYNLDRTNNLKRIGKYLSEEGPEGPTEGPEWNEEVLNLLDRLNELIRRKRDASPEEKEAIEKEIEKIREWLRDLWSRGGKRPPLPSGTENGDNSKSSIINPAIIIVGDDGIKVIPGPADGNNEKEPLVNVLFPKQFLAEVEEEATFWRDYTKKIVSAHPEVGETAKGITAEDILHGHVYKGKGLIAEYGLVYPVSSVNGNKRQSQ